MASTDNITTTFSDKLKEETKEKHKILDTHPFVKSIFAKSSESSESSESSITNTTTGYYLDLHLIILNEIKLILKEKSGEFPEYFKFFNKDYHQQHEVTDNLLNYKSVILLINKLHIDAYNKELLLSHMYIWWLGVLYGGQMIKRSIIKKNPDLSEYTSLIFDFECNVKEFIVDFKNYLDDTVIHKDEFIENVNIVYTFIKNVFDEIQLNEMELEIKYN
jgi:heme oxygenase